MRNYIGKIDFLTLVGECEDALQLNSLLKDKQADLLFLDIEMPEMTGIELLSSTSCLPKVVIVSAYEQYALAGYEFDVVDYLLKPVSFDRFLKSVNRVHDIMMSEQKDGSDYIFVKSDKRLKKIGFNDILFIESMENYVIIRTHSSKEIVYMTLKQLHESLPRTIFQQVHRSYIVNLEQIEAIEGNLLHMQSYKIPVARGFRDALFTRLFNDSLLKKRNPK